MLKGIKVLDCGVFGVGPGACSLLGYLGADVIRVEPPHVDPLLFAGTKQGGAGSGYLTSHYNKRNIILDLTTAEGQEIGLRLAERADILIENHLPGTMDRLGLGYEAVSAVNPRIIYCSSSSYGSTGPLAKMGSADSYIQMASGFASINGAPGDEGEVLRISGHIDHTTSITICQAVLSALLAREITGEGQKVEVSQFGAAIAIQASRMAEYFATGVNPRPMGSADPRIVPSQAFKALDNRYILVSVPREEYWPRLCKALGLEQLERDPRFISNPQRVKNRHKLIPILDRKFSEEPARWWLILLRRYDVPCGPINTFDDICLDPHILENHMIGEVDSDWGKIMHGHPPLQFSKAPRVLRITGAVKPDKNRKEILSEIGYRRKQDGVTASRD